MALSAVRLTNKECHMIPKKRKKMKTQNHNYTSRREMPELNRYKPYEL